MDGDVVSDKQPERKPEPTAQELRERMLELKKQLDRKERQEVSGAPIRSTKEELLDMSRLEEQQPDFHFRNVNTMDPQKIELRRRQGYVPVTEKEAQEAGQGLSAGPDLVRMKQPREEYERRQAELRKRNEERLRASKAEFVRTVEGVAKELRDRHGIEVNTDRLLVDEGQ